MPLLDKLREQYGVGPVCSELHIAPSTYYHCQQQRHHPDKRSARAQHDDWLKREIQRVYDENHQVYGVRKVWRQLLREGIRVARCTVARLMAVMGLAGVLRGKKVRTTISRKAVAAGDRVNRQFVAGKPYFFRRFQSGPITASRRLRSVTRTVFPCCSDLMSLRASRLGRMFRVSVTLSHSV